MYMIRLSSSNDNKYIIYSEKSYEYSIFEKDAKSGKFEPVQPTINKENLVVANHYYNMVDDEDNYEKQETVILIYKSSLIVDRRLLQEEAESDGDFIRIYYGTDPTCDLCDVRGRGLIVAAIVLSVLALIFIMIFMIIGFRKLCAKKRKDQFDLQKIKNSLPVDQEMEFKSNSYQEDESKKEELRNSDTFDVFKTNEDEMFQPNKTPNLALKKDMIGGNPVTGSK